MPLPRPNPPPPLFAPKDVLRLVAALSMMVLLVFAIGRFKNPRTWLWVEQTKRPSTAAQEPEIAPSASPLYRQALISQAIGFYALTPNPFTPIAFMALGAEGVASFEHVPLPVRPPPSGRHAPPPDGNILDLAIDRKGFLTDDPNESDYNNALKKGDADARYHLFELAAVANAADLAQDARRDVRYTALMQKPQDYRGDVIHIQGQLRWLRTFELTRSTIPGVTHFYEGLITVGPDGYWALFKDLPAGLPPAAQWNNLYVHDVGFDGYFLKVLLAKNSKGAIPFPLLIGRTLVLPPPEAESSLEASFWTLLIVVGGAGLVLSVIFWLHGLSERRYAARLAAVRAKAQAARLESGETDVAESASAHDNSDSDFPEKPRLNGQQRPPV